LFPFCDWDPKGASIEEYSIFPKKIGDGSMNETRSKQRTIV
jgi:hypothetical protein